MNTIYIIWQCAVLTYNILRKCVEPGRLIEQKYNPCTLIGCVRILVYSSNKQSHIYRDMENMEVYHVFVHALHNKPSLSCHNRYRSSIWLCQAVNVLFVLSWLLFALKQTQNKLAPCHHHYQANRGSQDSSTNLMLNKRVFMTRGIVMQPVIHL